MQAQETHMDIPPWTWYPSDPHFLYHSPVGLLGLRWGQVAMGRTWEN